MSLDESSRLLETFLFLVKDRSKSQIVKLSRFGSFSFKETPQRMGRNPKTKESYIINLQYKLNFKLSNKIKETLNK